MSREELKNQLRTLRETMFQMDAEQKKDIVFDGRVLEVPLGAERHKIRFYSGGEGIRPVYIDIHGGGMVWGSMENADPLARLLTGELGIHVIALDYPLVPDIEYPENVEYLYGTLRELVKCADRYGIDPGRMVIGGRSAGGNLAAVMCILSVARGEFSLRGQILDHPWLDLCGSIDWECRPKDEAMTEDTMKALALGYADPERQGEAACSPIMVDRETAGHLPPAIIQVCGLDPLKVEGERYAQILKDAGVPVTEWCFQDAPHGFSEGYTAQGEEGRRRLLEAVRKQSWFA